MVPTEELGVDLTLIDACLALTPTERLRRHEEAARAARALAKAGEEARARAARAR